MKVEARKSELALLNQMSMEELAKILVDLIENNCELRRVILELVRKCPNIITKE